MKRLAFAVAAVALVLVAPQAGAMSTMYSYGGAPVGIPDDGGAGSPGIASFAVADDFNITDLDVEINITHTWVGDLDIRIENQNTGASALLVQTIGTPGDGLGHLAANFYGTRFDDEAPTNINDAAPGDAPFTGSWSPEGSLAAFDGTSTLGTWNLVVDDLYGLDTGTIDDFTLHVQYDDPTQPIPEPRTLALFGLGLIGLVPVARKSFLG